MVDQGKLSSEIFVLQNGRKNVMAVAEWVKTKELKRSQLVSLSMSENRKEDGDNTIAIVYRENSKENPADTPLDTIEFKIFDPQTPWESLFREFEDFSKGRDILSLTHTAKNIGEGHYQTAWFTGTTASNNGPYNVQIFDNEGVEWEEILESAVEWMNKHIAPHNLVNISIFEQEHPNASGK
jgi:hypothetical protein